MCVFKVCVLFGDIQLLGEHVVVRKRPVLFLSRFPQLFLSPRGCRVESGVPDALAPSGEMSHDFQLFRHIPNSGRFGLANVDTLLFLLTIV